MSEFVVDPRDVSHARIRQRDAIVVQQGDVLVTVVHCAFTANNVSYALAGKSLRYFDFFPTGDPESAAVPSWGIGVVTASRSDDIVVGERLYGFFPYCQYTVLHPSRVRPDSFLDVSGPRGSLAAVYNTYNRVHTGRDPLYPSRELEDLTVIMRPLFLTSWLLRSFAQEAVQEKTRIVLTSASSKTAYALAYLLKQGDPLEAEVIGLTSEQNKSFVTRMGTYDKVVTYDEVEGQLPTNGPRCLIIDMSGNGALLTRLLKHVPDATCTLVGATHWDQGTKGLPGKFFFAPTYAERAIKALGPAKFNAAVRDDFSSFLKHVQQHQWCRVQHVNGSDAVLSMYNTALKDGIDPTGGLVASMWPVDARL